MNNNRSLSSKIIPSVQRVRIEILSGPDHPTVPEFYQNNPIKFHPINEIIDYEKTVILFFNKFNK